MIPNLTSLADSQTDNHNDHVISMSHFAQAQPVCNFYSVPQVAPCKQENNFIVDMCTIYGLLSLPPECLE